MRTLTIKEVLEIKEGFDKRIESGYSKGEAADSAIYFVLGGESKVLQNYYGELHTELTK